MCTCGQLFLDESKNPNFHTVLAHRSSKPFSHNTCALPISPWLVAVASAGAFSTCSAAISYRSCWYYLCVLHSMATTTTAFHELGTGVVGIALSITFCRFLFTITSMTTTSVKIPLVILSVFFMIARRVFRIPDQMGLCTLHPNFNGSHFGLPPSSIHRRTGLGGNFTWTIMYSHRPHSLVHTYLKKIFAAILQRATGTNPCQDQVIVSVRKFLHANVGCYLENQNKENKQGKHTFCKHKFLVEWSFSSLPLTARSL